MQKPNNIANPKKSPPLILHQQQTTLKKQQKTLHLNNLISTFSNPQIKKLQQFNQNKIERQLLEIASNFYSIIDKLDMMKSFCIDYKKTLETYKKEEKELEKLNKERLLAEKIDEQRDDLEDFNKRNQGSSEKIVDQAEEKSKIQSILQQQLAVDMQMNSLNISNGEVLNQQDNKPLIILPGRHLQTQQRQIQQTINKLKVMVVKVNTKESSSFEHVYSTYISRLKYVIIQLINNFIQTLQNSNLDEKRFKMHKIKKILNYLPKKYIILKLQSKGIYPYHPTRYPNYIPYNYVEYPMFFINYYTQQLLFMNFLPISLPKPYFSQLLYCPIILVKQKAQESLKISPWYLQQLSLIEPLWRSSILLIKIFNAGTSLTQPIFYSHINLKKFQLPIQLQTDIQSHNHGFNFMKHQYSNQQNLLSDLQSIKYFIYQSLVFNHLGKILKNKNSRNELTSLNKKLQIFIQEGGFVVQFDLVSDLEIKQRLMNKLNPQKNKNNMMGINGIDNYNLADIFSSGFQNENNKLPEPVYKPQFIMDLLFFYKKKNLFTMKKPVLKQELQIMFKATLFKVITEHMEYRTVSPAYSGSLGRYFYQKKSIKKQKVSDFLNQFNQ